MKTKQTSGESDLDTIIQSMQPVLHDEIYVFVTHNKGEDYASLSPLMMFQELEGTTLILTEAVAIAAGLSPEFPSRMITLNVHSALDAVGFMARFTTCLADLQIGVNLVSGFYHDHVFVPCDKAEDALQALKRFSKEWLPTVDDVRIPQANKTPPK